MPPPARFVVGTLIALCLSVGAGPALPSAARTTSTSSAVTAAQPDNPIVVENRQAGTFGWLPGPNAAGDATGQIKGYWSATSVRQNETITLYVTVNPSQTYALDIYRLGWYQGTGARLRLHEGSLSGTTQSPCVPDATTGLIACDWSASYTLSVPSDWTSGVYLGLLTNAQGFQNYVLFVVRDDRPAPFLYQQNIMTNQAYNNYPNDGRTGKSLYTYNSYGANTISGETRAVKVSFDRPYADFGFPQADEMEFIRWIERMGYDVTYSTNVDTHADGASLRNHKAFLSVGHDEYWSKEIFDAIEGARDAGVNLAFFAADTGSVQVRFEPSASGLPNRVMICYKSAAIDPVNGPTTTVAFRSPPVNRPEQALRGVMAFVGGMVTSGTLPDYVVTNSSHWIYAGTGLKDGDTVARIVGYEMDRYDSQFAPPNSPNWTLLSHSPFTNYQGNASYANSSIYQAPSRAWVFSSGTISWSRALDGFWHGSADPRIQQVTANLFSAFLNGAPEVQGLALSAPAAATAGTAFTVTVTAVDGQGAPVASYDGTIHFTSSDTSPGVVLPPDSTLSGGTGTFTITLAGTGSQTVTVSDAARSLSATATVVVSSAPRAEQLRISGPATATAGDAFSVTVSAVDGQGNPVPSYSGTIHFTSSDTAAAVRLPPDAALSGGQGTFNVTLTTAGAQTVTASDVASSLPSATASLTVGARAADHLALTTSASPASGSSFPFTVTSLDGFGNTDTAYAGKVRFTSSDTLPGVVLPPDSTLASGQGTFTATLVAPGSQTITGTDVGTPGISGTMSVAVAQTVRSLKVTAPATATAGAAFSVTVVAADARGDPVTGYGGTVHFASSDTSAGVSLPPDSPLTNGQRTFTVRLTRAGPQTLTVSSADGALTTTTNVAVSAAPATRLIVSTATPTPTAGTSLSFSVIAQDQFANTDLAYAGRVHFSSTDTSATVVLPADSTLVNGQGTFTATLTKAGPQTITATDKVVAAVTGNVAVTVQPAAAAKLTLGAPNSARAGQSFPVTVTLTDQFGNVASGYRGAVHFTSSDLLPTVVLPADYRFTAADAGAHSFSVTLWTIGGQTITVRDTVNAALSDSHSVSVGLL